MDAFSLAPDGPLPDDVPSLHTLLRQVLVEMARLRAENSELRADNDKLRADNTDLRGKLDAALKHRFGRRSERRPLADALPKQKPGRARPHGRTVLPEHLERREVVHDLTEAEKLCPCCGRPRVCIGEQSAEQLDLEPAHFFVRRTIKKSYACQHCEPERVPPEQRIQTAGPAEVGPIARGLCGPGLLAHAITAKYADHIPLFRLAGQLARSGVRIARSTLGDWMAGAAHLLEPLYHLMHERLLFSRVLHGDDTGVKLRVVGATKTRRAHLWVCIGDADYPYVVFDFTADYTAEGPESFLQAYRGYLQADALAQYEGLYGEDRIQHVCCWAHARRKFVAALEGGDAGARAALDWIGELYVIERELLPLLSVGEGPEQRRQREEQRKQVRQLRAGPVLAAFEAWLADQKGQVLPKSALGQAVGYALNNWSALIRYQDQGYLAIDNNLSERTLRAIAVGRNNWGVVGSEGGGQTAAVLFSIVGTCKHLGLDPFSYLRAALPGLFALGEKPSVEQLQAWLPDRWLGCRNGVSPDRPAAAG